MRRLYSSRRHRWQQSVRLLLLLVLPVVLCTFCPVELAAFAASRPPRQLSVSQRLSERIARADSQKAIGSIVEDARDRFQTVNLVAALVQMVTVKGEPESRALAWLEKEVQAAARRALQARRGNRAEIGPQACHIVMWACAKLGTPGLLDALSPLAELAGRQADDLQPRHMSTILWCIATFRDAVAVDLREILPRLTAAVGRKANAMSGRDISNIIWASAKLKATAPDLLSILPGLAKELRRKAAELKTVDIANTLWASAVLKGEAPDLLRLVPLLADAAVKRVDKMKMHFLQIIMWAVVELRDAFPKPSAVRLTRAALRKVRGMKPAAVTDLVWASATLRDDSQELLRSLPKLASVAKSKAPELTAQEAVILVWATASLLYAAPELLDTMPEFVASARPRAESMSAQELANVIWAGAVLKSASPDLLQAVPRFTSAALSKAKAGELDEYSTQMQWASLELGEVEPRLRQVQVAVKASASKRRARKAEPVKLVRKARRAKRGLLSSDQPRASSSVPSVTSDRAGLRKPMVPSRWRDKGAADLQRDQ